MSEALQRASRTRGLGLLAMIPGLLFLLAGVAIIFEPQVLVWLVATLSIAVGVALTAAVSVVWKIQGR